MVEQFLHNGFYSLLASSLYITSYQRSDGVWRNIRYAKSLLVGKEWSTSKNKFGLNLKLSYYGGFRNTLIGIAESKRLSETVYVRSLAFTQQLPDYFRPYVRLSWKKNRPHSTRILSLDLQNALNRQNVYDHFFDPNSGVVKTITALV